MRERRFTRHGVSLNFEAAIHDVPISNRVVPKSGGSLADPGNRVASVFAEHDAKHNCIHASMLQQNCCHASADRAIDQNLLTS
jgi:hypothetical protein